MTLSMPRLIDDFDSSLGEGTLLFGGSGFLGPYILQNYPGVISVGRNPPIADSRHIHVDDLSDLSALKDVEFDKVIYIVGNTDHHNLEIETLAPGHPNAYDYHVTPLVRTLEQLKNRRLKRFIHFSTVLVYAENQPKLPVAEDAPIDPYRNRYVNSKFLGEEACKFYSQWVPITNVRFANLYGPTPLERYDLIHVTSRKLLDKGRAEIWTTKPSRDFIYVEDAAHAVVKLLEADHNGTVNLGTGQMTSVARVIELLREVSGCEIVDMDKQVNGPYKFSCDRTLLDRLIDWEPQISIEQGVRTTFNQMKAWVDG